MTSTHTALDVNRAQYAMADAADPSTADSLMLKLTGAPLVCRRNATHTDWTGLRVEMDPQSQFRPSKKLRLAVDGIKRSVAFQSSDSEGLSSWTWEVVSETV